MKAVPNNLRAVLTLACALAFMMLAASHVAGQTSYINVHVEDEQGNALEGVTLTLNGENYTTNASGSYNISLANPGTYKLIVEKPRYVRQELMVTTNDTYNIILRRVKPPSVPQVYEHIAAMVGMLVVILAGIYLFLKKE